jgi:mannose-1-phosphate guanylyltransferase/mannose-6-phosphate isomerase
LGVTPTHPETGYGYIQKQGDANTNHAFAVAKFTEKPNQETAQEYINSGDIYGIVAYLSCKLILGCKL